MCTAEIRPTVRYVLLKYTACWAQVMDRSAGFRLYRLLAMCLYWLVVPPTCPVSILVCLYRLLSLCLYWLVVPPTGPLCKLVGCTATRAAYWMVQTACCTLSTVRHMISFDSGQSRCADEGVLVLCVLCVL